MMFGLILHSELQEGRGSATASVRSGSPVPPPYTPYDDSQVAEAPDISSSLSRNVTRVGPSENNVPHRTYSNPSPSSSRNPFASEVISSSNSSLPPALRTLSYLRVDDVLQAFGLKSSPSLSKKSTSSHSDPPIATENPPVLAQPDAFSEPPHCTRPPFTVQSLGVDLADGFPHVELASDFYRNSEIKHEDWQRFIGHTNTRINGSALEDPSGYMEGAQAYVAQWSAAFFEPRGLKVSLRSGGIRKYPSLDSSDPVDDVYSHLNTSTGLTPPTSPSVSSVSLFPTDLVPATWTSPKAEAAHAATCKIVEKLERERQKHERRTRAAQKKAAKATQKIERKVRKAMQKRAKREAKTARKESKKNKKSVNSNVVSVVEYAVESWMEMDEECWELVVEYS